MKKYGFTLVEILVTLSIVGVISALTLPTLVSNTMDAQIGPKLAKAVSTFEQANEALLNSRSSDSLTDAGLTTSTDYMTALSGFYKITTETSNSFRTKDDILFTIPANFQAEVNGSPYQQRIQGEVVVNINPSSNIDSFGTNKFVFSFWNDGSLRPKGGTNWDGSDDKECSVDLVKNADDELICPNTAEGKSQETQVKSRKNGSKHWTKNCDAGVAPKDSTFCAGHIFENNLKVFYK